LPSFRDIRIPARFVDFQLRSSSIAKDESIIGIKSDRLVVIGDGSAVVALVRISDAPVVKGQSVVGIQSNRLAEIGNGSILVAFIRIR
jgi:hypothetical protein